MFIDLCKDMSIGMRIDIRIDMCIDMRLTKLQSSSRHVAIAIQKRAVYAIGYTRL